MQKVDLSLQHEARYSCPKCGKLLNRNRGTVKYHWIHQHNASEVEAQLEAERGCEGVNQTHPKMTTTNRRTTLIVNAAIDAMKTDSNAARSHQVMGNDKGEKAQNHDFTPKRQLSEIILPEQIQIKRSRFADVKDLLRASVVVGHKNTTNVQPAVDNGKIASPTPPIPTAD